MSAVPTAEGTKVCTKCGIEKPLDEFAKRKDRKAGRYPSCKACKRKVNKVQYRRRRAANLEEERLKGIVNAHAARARECGCEGSFTVQDIRDLYERWGYRCLCCGAVDKELTLDHVVPLAFGGRNDLSNLQPLCRGCNAAKGRESMDFRTLRPVQAMARAA